MSPETVEPIVIVSVGTPTRRAKEARASSPGMPQCSQLVRPPRQSSRAPSSASRLCRGGRPYEAVFRYVETGAHRDCASTTDRRFIRRVLPAPLDSVEVARAAEKQPLWGSETAKAVENFPVSGEPIPVSVARWLGRIKAAAARVNADLELLDRDKAERIAAAADRVAAGEFDDQFPIDVFQTGSGTSSNMNANEVIAALAGEDVHPNDDVNMGQSSNDVFPSAVHLAALGEVAHDLLPALELLWVSLERKAVEFDDVVKSGRTHLMDAVPVTLGQEFSGYAAQIRQGIARVEDAMPRLAQIPLGGTATGTGLNTHPEFAARVREYLARETGLAVSAPADHFEAQAARDGLVEISGALKVVAVSLTKIANDLRLMGSGPRAGLAEIFLPELQKGSSIMPGKVNPVIPEVVTQVAAQVIGNDTAITIGGMNGQFELNVYIPLMARNLLDSVRLLASASRLLSEKCVEGIEVNRERTEHFAESTLSAATALNPYIGYDKASEIVKEAAASGRSLRDVARDAGVDEAILDDALDYRGMARPHGGEPAPDRSSQDPYLTDRRPVTTSGVALGPSECHTTRGEACESSLFAGCDRRRVAMIAVPASAITDGELDGEQHPYVGLMVAQLADGTPLWRCSGTLDVSDDLPDRRPLHRGSRRACRDSGSSPTSSPEFRQTATRSRGRSAALRTGIHSTTRTRSISTTSASSSSTSRSRRPCTGSCRR